MLPRLPREFYDRHTVKVARDLLGKLVVRRCTDGKLSAGRIVETEAYHGFHDRASHARRGRTPRNAPMFGPAGHAYVYRIYGVWNCLNLVTMRADFPAAVLIRALAPVAGYPPRGDERTAAGPGKLCRAFDIDTGLSGADVVGGEELWVADDGVAPGRATVRVGPRINVDYAGPCAERPWRFWIAGERAVSIRRRRE